TQPEMVGIIAIIRHRPIPKIHDISLSKSRVGSSNFITEANRTVAVSGISGYGGNRHWWETAIHSMKAHHPACLLADRMLDAFLKKEK
ncbi:MAG: hypothetical protein L0Y56_22810, partial [Nitrospira sp.]|nr:hypothetical protein [Nitrospira sp.]